MKVLEAEVLIVGAGPAGLAAGVAAATSGRRTLILDDNPAAGGQIWRKSVSGAVPERMKRMVADLAQQSVEIRNDATLVASDGPHAHLVLWRDQGLEVRCEKLVLATGSVEHFLPLPGWTLPGVLGVGGLQALCKQGLAVEGKRILLAGSGPLLFAVGADLVERGARVVGIIEQASPASIRRMGLSLIFQPSRLLQAVSLLRKLRGVSRFFGMHPRCVERSEEGQLAVTLSDGRRMEELDFVGLGFGLVPERRVALALGCDVDESGVRVDARQETSVPGVYCAGEACGIGGVDLSLAEGELAGLCAAGRSDGLSRPRRRVRRLRAAAARLLTAYRLGEELKSLPEASTVVCRCEDSRFEEVHGESSMRSAKLAARCGMGPCQARVCGPALEWLEGFSPERPRAPLSPVPYAVLEAWASRALDLGSGTGA